MFKDVIDYTSANYIKTIVLLNGDVFIGVDFKESMDRWERETIAKINKGEGSVLIENRVGCAIIPASRISYISVFAPSFDIPALEEEYGVKFEKVLLPSEEG